MSPLYNPDRVVNLAASNTTYTSGTVVLTGGANVTVTTNGQTVSISGAAQTVQTQNLHNVTLSGNTAGVMAQVSSGTMTLAGGNNVVLSQAGNAVTISASNQSVQTQNAVDLTLAGNTSGALALVSSGTATLAGGNNVTLSQAGNAITISAAAQSVQTQNAVDATIAGNTSGALALVSSGTMTLAGGNNITLSQAGNAITISAPNLGAGAMSVGVSTGGNTAGATGVTGTRLVLVGTNAISLSQTTDANGGTVSINVASQTVQTQNLVDITLAGNTAGALALVSSGTATLAGGNNITLSQAGNAITISGFAPVTHRSYDANKDNALQIQQHGNGTVVVAPYPFHVNAQFDRVVLGIHASASSNSTGTLTCSFWVAIHSNNAATLSSVASTSGTVTIPYSGTASSATHFGPRIFTLGWTTTITQGDYWVAVASRSTTAGTNASLSQIVLSKLNSNFSGQLGAALNASNQLVLGQGYYSVTSAGIPTTMAISDIRGTGSDQRRAPMVFFQSGAPA